MPRPTTITPDTMDLGFDMRLRYYESLGKLFEVISFAGAMNDYTQRIYCVKQVLDLVSPFIEPQKIEELDVMLSEASRLNIKVLQAMNNKDRAIRNQIMQDEEELRTKISKATRKLLVAMAAKKMLIPMKVTETDDSDDSLAAGMGL